MDLGKIPPQAVELEEAVLGAIIVESQIFESVKPILTAESFYKDSHQKIYMVICELFDKHQPIDMLTVSELLSNKDLLEETGGHYYISQLTTKVASGIHTVEHAKIIAEKFMRRELIRICYETERTMFDEETDFMSEINHLDSKIKEVVSFTRKDEKHIRQAVDEMVEYSIKLNDNTAPKGIPTGFTYFDEFSGGIQRGDLLIIGGEPSNGKTTLALNMVRNSSKRGTKCGIFSFEMTAFQLAARMVAHDQKIISKDIIRGKLTSKELVAISNNVSRLTDSEIYIIKPNSTNFNKLTHDISRMVKLYDLDFVVIDYLQLINNSLKGLSKADSTAEMANKLKSFTVELNIATALLSQLARDRSNPRPSMTRLKNSGDIEAAADIIMLPYLPFKYGKTVENVNGESVEIGHNGIVIVDKGRNIGTTEFTLEFKEEIPAFFNMSKDLDWVNDYEPKQENCPFND